MTVEAGSHRRALPALVLSCLWIATGLTGCSASLFQLSVAANPNSVLSAVATVSWIGWLSSVSVTVQPAGGAKQVTPIKSLTGVGSPVTVPLLPLKAETTYVIQATARETDGRTLTSNSVTFTTGKLPAGVPIFTVADGGTPSPGDTLVARVEAPDLNITDYLTIVDETGAPVWYYPAYPALACDFQQQPDGSFTIAIDNTWQAVPGVSTEAAVYRQIDVLGNTLHTWSALDVPSASPPIQSLGTDIHEIRLQPNGDALLFALIEEPMDLSAYGGQANASLLGEVLERVTPQGKVSFAWNALSHVSVANVSPVAVDLTAPVVDFTHANSIDVMDDGNYLVSLRNLSQVLKIDATTGAVLWKLGGLDSDFTFVNDPLQSFSCQHGARELPNGDIILFDDGNGHTPPQSRAVEYKLDLTAMTATLVWSAEDTPALYTYIQGFAQRLTNGNTLVTYGVALHVQEVDPDGAVLWDLTDPTQPQGLYRAFRLDSLSSLMLTPG